MSYGPSPTTTFHSKTYPALSPTRPELSAKGKNVIITGGGTGIGAETARYYAQAGASRIAILGRREQPLLETKELIERDHAGIDIFALVTDITSKDQVNAAFSQFAEGGQIHVLISGAAVTGPQGAVKDVDSVKFLEAIHQNIQGSLHVAQAFLQYCSNDAVAIEINSSAAYLDFGPEIACYSVAKLAVFRLWDSVAAAHPDIRVFHVQPGVIDTQMSQEARGDVPLDYEDDASFNLWLASSEACFLNRKFVWANWDVNELKAQSKEIGNGSKLDIGLIG
ncbi:hypothetical protein N7481_008613 [Penicillium waksmanii]|uniref:uncharacterized protein n=1 Tax=Penicillium waksmanii TaxID=69791 RepID=UPI002547177D|nr:uncharacterized protein N7481_008613 [Penicillium waksmanii]KAJ5974906.1 hypothetical protein N7481_008613 [Penicillium waksmanii]